MIKLYTISNQEVLIITELPIAPVGRILKNNGAQRVSDDAKITLTEAMKDYDEKIAKETIKLAQHTGRKTITGKDIKLALKI